jgi:hypothetical protein
MVVEEWLTRLDRFESLTLRGPDRATVEVRRLAGMYLLGTHDRSGKTVWWADVSPEARAALQGRLEPRAAWTPTWAPAPAGVQDPFDAGCVLSYADSNAGFSSDWTVSRQPDGRFLLDYEERFDDSAGVAPPVKEEHVLLTREEARARLMQRLPNGCTRWLLPSVSEAK